MARASRSAFALAWLTCLVVAAAGCTGRGEEVPRTFPQALVLGGTRYEPSQLRRGADVYGLYCRPCHGVNGDGQGLSAGALQPPPRDLRLGIFKFASVAAGELPTDEDLRRTLRQGLAGTAMRSWDLPEAELDALLGYVKTFSPRWASEKPGTPLEPSPDPWSGRAGEAIRRGELVYHGLAQCAVACHPAYLPREQIRAATLSLSHLELSTFRADLYDGVAKPSDYGYAIVPPDFTFHRLRRGTELVELYRVIAAGVGGTAMPTWRGVLPEADLWSLAYYVRSLTALRDTVSARKLRAGLIESEADGASAR